MKKVLICLSVLFLSGCISAVISIKKMNRNIDDSLTTKTINMDYAKNTKNKDGKLVKIRYENSILNPINKYPDMQTYNIFVFYTGCSSYINKSIFYSVNDIPMNSENEIYIPIQENCDIYSISISGKMFFSNSYTYNTYIDILAKLPSSTSADRLYYDYIPFEEGQVFTFENEEVKIEVEPYLSNKILKYYKVSKDKRAHWKD